MDEKTRNRQRARIAFLQKLSKTLRIFMENHLQQINITTTRKSFPAQGPNFLL
jgi:hypothetical protein